MSTPAKVPGAGTAATDDTAQAGAGTAKRRSRKTSASPPPGMGVDTAATVVPGATAGAVAAISAAPAGGLMRAPADGAAIRMYRQGLGDCFLLAFPTTDPGQDYYVMIDCGLILGTPQSSQRAKEVAADIKAATAGHVGLLVATHRHYDHISGFKLAGDIFSSIQFDNLWLPWLENPADKETQKIWSATAQALEALNSAIARAPAAMAHVRDVLSFLGEDLGASAKDKDAFAPVKALVPGDPCWCRPGDGPLALPAAAGSPDVPGAKVYVLGPPVDQAWIRKMNPGAGAGRETYLSQFGLDAHLAFALGMLPASGQSADERCLAELSFPFDEYLQVKAADARNVEFFRDHYGFSGLSDDQSGPPDSGPSSATTTAAGGAPASDAGSSPAPTPSAEDAPGELDPSSELDASDAGESDAPAAAAGADDEAWRRIDSDWLTEAEELALQIDSVCNNTSLVLAFEFAASKRVLLFAADAQVGNWLSWHGLQWRRADGSTVTADDLLQNTVLYKVGHHGSHNATVKQLSDGKDWGLTRMLHPELVAMIPCDTVIAAQQSGSWKMPNPDLLPHIQDATRGRVLRIDEGIPTQPGGTRPAGPAAWQDFLARISPDPATIKPFPPGVPSSSTAGKIVRGPVQAEPGYIEFRVRG